MKLLLAGLALLTASQIYINKGYSSESLIEKDSNSEEVNQKKTTYTSNGKKIQTVISLGIGVTPQGAAQNALENALTQVVGSFIDTETILAKKTEIRDGVVAKSKELLKKISDYSQGSIKSFEILNTAQNGSIYNVTARVDVRIEDFRAYIKELAYGSKKINTGLFSVIKTEEDNIQGKLDLIAKVINPVLGGEVIDIKIGDPERLTEVSAFGCSYSQLQSGRHRIFCPTMEKKSYGDNIYTNVKKNATLIIPVTFTLKKDYLENSIKILDNISDQKTSYLGAYWQYLPKVENNLNNDEDYFFSIFKRESKEGFGYLLSSMRKLNQERQGNQVPIDVPNNYPRPKLRFNFKDKESKILLSLENICLSQGLNNVRDYVNYGCQLSSSPYIRFVKLSTIYENGFPYKWSMNKLSFLYEGSGIRAELRDRLNALLIIEPNELLINNLHEISIEYIQK